MIDLAKWQNPAKNKMAKAFSDFRICGRITQYNNGKQFRKAYRGQSSTGSTENQ